MPSTLQAEIEAILQRHIAAGSEGAIQVAAYHRGELIVDAWAGPAGDAVDGDTLFAVYSTGKGIAATAIHRLVERGVLAYDEPVATWWPAFAAAGKERVTLRMLLDHTAGLFALPAEGRMEDLGDWDAMAAWFAAQPPAHEPGTRREYHAVSYAWLLGETARRADGRDIRTLIREECCDPIGVTDCWFGVDEDQLHRVHEVETPRDKEPTTPSAAVPAWILPLEDLMNIPAVRRSCCPASTGIMNARSIARHYAALVGGGVDGVRLIGDATLDAALEARPVGDEEHAGRGMGYLRLDAERDPCTRFGHGGYDGSTGQGDRALELGIGVAKARTGSGAATQDAVQAIRAAVV